MADERPSRWRLLWSPTTRWSLGGLLATGAAAGVLLLGAFNGVLEATNTEAFCISCHEMRDTMYKELAGTVHGTNRTGVRASCPDCHVPREWGPKIARKARAATEVYHHILGTIDTPEKFERHRNEMAESVWREMKANDSRECRHCHSPASMDASKQKEWSAPAHRAAMKDGQTCIDCHKGIAHQLPK